MKEKMKNRRDKQKAETNALILEKAKSLFEEVGFEKTTMRRIADLAGISPATIIKHFKNKSDLLAAALYNDIEAVQKKALNNTPQDKSVKNQFLFIADRFFTYYAKRPALSKILVEHSLFIEGEWRNNFNNQSIALVKFTARLIEKEKNKNKIKRNVDSVLLSSALYSHYIFNLLLFINNPPLDPVISIHRLESFIDQTIAGAILEKSEEHGV